jgi:hypothetical protein
MTVATFVLIHGGGDIGWYWHLVERELRQRGHDTLAPDLPCDDDSAGLAEYADTVLKAIGGRRGLIVAAQSFGGFTAPLVAARVPVDMLILVAAMVPAPGESPGDWSANTGFDAVLGQQAQRYSGQDLIYQDVPPALAEQARRNARDQSDTPGHARGRWTHGRRCRPVSCSAPKTGSSRPSSCAGSWPTAWASSRTR